MTQNTITAGGASDLIAIQGGDDGTLLVKVGPSGAKVNALSIAADGTPTFLKSGMVLGTSQNTTSGTSIDFTGIPSWTKRITVTLVGVSISGASNIVLRLGTSGGVDAATYLGSSIVVVNAGASNGLLLSTGFELPSQLGAADVFGGDIDFKVSTANTWTAKGVLGMTNSGRAVVIGGSKALSGALDRIRLTTVNGTDTFDAGSVNILYEG